MHLLHNCQKSQVLNRHIENVLENRVSSRACVPFPMCPSGIAYVTEQIRVRIFEVQEPSLA